MRAHNNPSLMHILVDDPAYSQANWTQVGMTTQPGNFFHGFNTNAQFCSGYNGATQTYSGCVTVQ